MQSSYTQIAQFGRILGSLFYAEPNTEQNQLLVALLQNGEWQAECLFLSENKRSEIQKNLQNATSEQLNEAYQLTNYVRNMVKSKMSHHCHHRTTPSRIWYYA